MSNFPINPLNPIPQEFKKIQGIDKLSRQIEKEIKSPNVNEKSSNLPHLLSILKCIQNLTPPEGDKAKEGEGHNPEEKGQDGSQNGQKSSRKPQLPSAVLKPFTFSKGRSGRLLVDIVSPDGDCWYKVSARNPKALSLLAAGGGNFGQKSIVDHVEDYLDCGRENPCLFRTPKVTAIFTSGISESLAQELEALGAYVQGQRIPDEEVGVHPRIKVFDFQEPFLNLDQDKPIGTHPSGCNDVEDDEESVLGFKNPSLDGVTKLNLDITVFLAYASNITNGHSNVKFPKTILADQAKAEGERPQKVVLDKIFHGRELYCCETALREFRVILSTVGGPEEKQRSEEFISRITIVPDQVSDRVKTLSVSGNIKNRSLVIFGTGDSIEAVTITANSGFVRSAKTQGVDLAAYIHESRALTEQKENLIKSKSS